jgi:DeoR/GlpR family transcriptional regulator of sugar metabolism
MAKSKRERIMLPEERRNKILDLLQKNSSNVVGVNELSSKLGVSSSTIRRDLLIMKEKKLIERIFRGASLPHQSEHDLFFDHRVNLNKEEKERIGAAAASLIKESGVVMLDIGTTILQVAKHIKPELEDILVITTSIDIAVELENTRNVKVILTGGELDGRTHGLFGPLVDEMIAKLMIDKLFIGVQGISKEELMDFNLQFLQNKRLAISKAKEIIVVSDHSKFGKTGLVSLVPITSVHKIIVGREAPTEYVEAIREKGVEIILA